MACVFKNFKGECFFYKSENPDELGCDNKGKCVVDDDLNPDEICMFYEQEGDDND